MIRASLAALMVMVLAAPFAVAQNSPGDECIIRVTLHDDLTTLTISYDLLFDDEAWHNLTSRIDDGDGIITAAEIAAYEARVFAHVSTPLPEQRRASLAAGFDHGSYSGTAGAVAHAATNATKLLNFEGPVAERTGKVVQEIWTYKFDDPLAEYGAPRLKTHAQFINIAWGPDAEMEPFSSVTVIETVVATPPENWWVRADGERHKAYTFASGNGYTITFEPNVIPIDSTNWIPGPGVAGIALALYVAMRRQ